MLREHPGLGPNLLGEPLNLDKVKSTLNPILPSHGYIPHTQARTPSGVQKLAKPTVQYLTIQSPDGTVTNRGLYFSELEVLVVPVYPQPNCLPLHLTHAKHQLQAPSGALGEGNSASASRCWSFLIPNPQSVWNSPCLCPTVRFPSTSKCLFVFKRPDAKTHLLCYLKTKQKKQRVRTCPTQFALLLTSQVSVDKGWMCPSALHILGWMWFVCMGRRSSAGWWSKAQRG